MDQLFLWKGLQLIAYLFDFLITPKYSYFKKLKIFNDFVYLIEWYTLLSIWSTTHFSIIYFFFEKKKKKFLKSKQLKLLNNWTIYYFTQKVPTNSNFCSKNKNSSTSWLNYYWSSFLSPHVILPIINCSRRTSFFFFQILFIFPETTNFLVNSFNNSRSFFFSF